MFWLVTILSVLLCLKILEVANWPWSYDIMQLHYKPVYIPQRIVHEVEYTTCDLLMMYPWNNDKVFWNLQWINLVFSNFLKADYVWKIVREKSHLETAQLTTSINSFHTLYYRAFIWKWLCFGRLNCFSFLFPHLIIICFGYQMISESYVVNRVSVGRWINSGGLGFSDFI